MVAPPSLLIGGVNETTQAIPVHGTWKALIRLQPVHTPEGSAIPASAVSVSTSFDRPFVDETQILQRELKSGAPGDLAGSPTRSSSRPGRERRRERQG